MNYRVVFTPEAGDQLLELFRYIASATSPGTAARYTGAIVNYCDSLSASPLRGTQRNDVRPGLRITHYKNVPLSRSTFLAKPCPSWASSTADRITNRCCKSTPKTSN